MDSISRPAYPKPRALPLGYEAISHSLPSRFFMLYNRQKIKIKKNSIQIRTPDFSNDSSARYH